MAHSRNLVTPESCPLSPDNEPVDPKNLLLALRRSSTKSSFDATSFPLFLTPPVLQSTAICAAYSMSSPTVEEFKSALPSILKNIPSDWYGTTFANLALKVCENVERARRLFNKGIMPMPKKQRNHAFFTNCYSPS